MVAVHPRERLALEPLKRRQSHVATANGRFTPILEAVIYVSLLSNMFILCHISIVALLVEMATDSFLIVFCQLSCRWEELVTTYDAMELMVHRQLGYISRPILHGNAIVG